MWVEKYRPTEITDVVGQRGTINSIQGLLENVAQMPHLLFSGSAGTGKTTTALCIAQHILGENRPNYTLELNASDERGIDMVREKVKRFSRYAGMGEIPFKIIILDEADEMTSGAQTALRRIIEDAAKYCRFIIIANNVSKIIDPIQSRCANFRFTSISKEEVMGRLRQIAEAEGIPIDDESLEMIHDYSGGDMRYSINLMQASVSDSSITTDSVRAMAGLAKVTDVDRILQMAIDGNFTEARQKTVELIKTYGMSESDFLKYITAAAFKLERVDPSRVVRIIAEYDYRILSGANAEIQLSAMLSELASK
ncbi:MAG: replication factor C small subunit [Cenarchaeum sp. SB0665_bin_23]|nr:replication factor C small subunit [Cenarchaeum sp. SB0667_bin_13]MXY37398.1 replication factor C small subunit [Cenarchaeum sp. SB0664_bin_35]MXY61526.1 replication factor C small subunit [Cenarchaeum sp. SB0665_bin_23]MXZ93089.1 replication factor C small subunit [Cenarchaeum sp. SB0666_bin_15]MYB47600.1 replication factor C small subunit [Cenarchaeum sp. SB0662_bin_33]MYC79253.1 replication factor C small subunit [Cenarchaeum sp. SB0661_bin_35]MYD59180.1 replication factor C small subun